MAEEDIRLRCLELAGKIYGNDSIRPTAEQLAVIAAFWAATVIAGYVPSNVASTTDEGNG